MANRRYMHPTTAAPSPTHARQHRWSTPARFPILPASRLFACYTSPFSFVQLPHHHQNPESRRRLSFRPPLSPQTDDILAFLPLNGWKPAISRPLSVAASKPRQLRQCHRAIRLCLGRRFVQTAEIAHHSCFWRGRSERMDTATGQVLERRRKIFREKWLFAPNPFLR